MKPVFLSALAVATLAACETVEVGRDADGARMLFESPRTVTASSRMYAIMVRGNLYEIEPGEARQGWRIGASAAPTFRNVPPPDEDGAADAVLHMAEEIGIGCDAPSKLVVVRLGPAGASDGSQAWRMSPDCR